MKEEEEQYRVDYTTGEVYELRASELGGYEYIFIGNLNGQSFEAFLRRREAQDYIRNI